MPLTVDYQFIRLAGIDQPPAINITSFFIRPLSVKIYNENL